MGLNWEYNSKLGIIEKREIEKYKKIWISQDTFMLHTKKNCQHLKLLTNDISWHRLQNDSAVVIEENYSFESFVHKYTDILICTVYLQQVHVLHAQCNFISILNQAIHKKMFVWNCRLEVSRPRRQGEFFFQTFSKVLLIKN